MRRVLLSLFAGAALLAASSEVLVLPEALRGAWPANSGIEVRFESVKRARIVDSGGVTRMSFAGDESVEKIALGVKTWRLGREVYDAQCARCHGADGTLEDYPGVKSLAGIGQRYSEARIIEAVERGGRVDMSGMKAAEKHALAVYVAGL